MPMIHPAPCRPAPRRRRAFAARLDPLEARVVLTTTTALDPSFGTRGVVLGATSPSDMSLSAGTAVAVQADGRIVEVGQVGQASATLNPGLAARRYNADGSLDTTFGTNGQVTIPNSATANGFSLTPKNVVIEPGGDIVFAAVAGNPVVGMSGFVTFNSVVVRLTPTGQLDSTFGTGGEFAVPQADGDLASVAVQANGSIVAAGLNSAGNAISVIRLTSSGALDTTFNATGLASVVLPTTGLTGVLSNPSFAALAVTPAGQVLVGGNVFTVFGHEYLYDTVLAELQADGTLNSSFGTAGFAYSNLSQVDTISALAVQPDGAIVVAGNHEFVSPSIGVVPATALARLTPSGAVDPTFTTTVASESGGEAVTSAALGTDGTITVAGNKTIGTRNYPFVARYLATGAVDPSFGLGGRALLNFSPTFSGGSPTAPVYSLNGVATTAGGAILVVGSTQNLYKDPITGATGANQGNQAFLARVLPVKTVEVANDYDGDAKSDIAGVLGAFGLYAYRPSDGSADVLASFGPATVGAAIPAPGDYDGDGKADIAAYFPAYGALVYRPSSGGADVVVPIGIAGAGNSIPAPGDYDGDGRTDPAVYLPKLGILAYRPSTGGQDVIVPFGIAGAGQSIPAPGDYDGDGKTDPAVYLSALGVLAYRPSSGGADVLTQFGFGGTGGSIPAPGDYDGDGRTDLAVYLPSIGYFAERPSSGGADVLSQFGAAGAMQTVPASSIPAAFASSSTGTVAASAVGGSVAVQDLALTDDLTSAELVQARKRKQAMS